MLLNKNGKFKSIKLNDYSNCDYKTLKHKALKCKRCHLRKSCTQVVMGEGNINNKIMFIGEGPGATEDKKGRPFVGRAGQLMNKILKAVSIKRRDVYITNIVKCRPPNNRKPNTSEAKACSPILKTEFNIIKPKVIVPLGATAFKYLLDEPTSITKSRGKWFQRGNYYFLPTFHPAYLLRNESKKKPAWKDFKLIKKSIDRINELKKRKS